jgi:hypothetical protein
MSPNSCSEISLRAGSCFDSEKRFPGVAAADSGRLLSFAEIGSTLVLGREGERERRHIGEAGAAVDVCSTAHVHAKRGIARTGVSAERDMRRQSRRR